jgi:hypothetical protein
MTQLKHFSKRLDLGENEVERAASARAEKCWCKSVSAGVAGWDFCADHRSQEWLPLVTSQTIGDNKLLHWICDTSK